MHFILPPLTALQEPGTSPLACLGEIAACACSTRAWAALRRGGGLGAGILTWEDLRAVAACARRDQEP